jgi:hypothetical protein
MQQTSHKLNTSGKVRLQDNHVFWEYDDKVILQIDLNDVVVIGEHTNSDGPYLDDWFLTFVLKDGQWQSISLYVDNIDQLTQHLTDNLHQDLNSCYLTGSTVWKSTIRYPGHLKGETLFRLTPSKGYKTPRTFLDKIVFGLGLGNFDTTQTIDLTDAVKQELQNACR